MKRIAIIAATSVVLFAQTFIVRANQLPADLSLYKEEVSPLLALTTNSNVLNYLRSCLADADLLKGFSAGDARVSEVFKKIAAARTEWSDKLGPNRRDPVVAQEQAAYDGHLQDYVKDEYIGLIRLQDELFERKYFENQTSKSANYFEGLLNSHWAFTRADRGNPQDVLKEPTLGVSPWEAILRFEPTYVFDGGGQGAIMGTFGLTRTFFPDITRDEKGVTFDETFWSKTVQKAGLRAGVGVGKFDDETKLLIGAGAQVWSVAIWGLYEPDDSEFLFGVGMSDLSKLKKLIGWFD